MLAVLCWRGLCWGRCFEGAVVEGLMQSLQDNSPAYQTASDKKKYLGQIIDCHLMIYCSRSFRADTCLICAIKLRVPGGNNVICII